MQEVKWHVEVASATVKHRMLNDGGCHSLTGSNSL